MTSDEKILILGSKPDKDIWYYPKSDDIVNRNDGTTRNLFKSSYAKIHKFPGTNLFFLGYEQGDATLVVPHKLKYLGFENYNFKKSFVMTTSKRSKGRMRAKGKDKGSEYEKYIFERDLLEFNDDSEYAYFILLMNDLINKPEYGQSTIELVNVSSIAKGI